MVDPVLFFIIDNLLQSQVSNGLPIQIDLLPILQEKKSVLRDDNIRVHVDTIVQVMFFMTAGVYLVGVFRLLAKVLLRVL